MKIRRKHMTHLTRPWLVIGAVAVLMGGCGGKTGELTGRVTFQDQALQQGTVMVVAAGGTVHSGVIQSDGTYTIPGIPVGPAKIAVNCPDPRDVKVIPRKKEEKGPAAEDSKWTPVPEKYAEPDESGLSVEIKSGPNTFHIDLK